MSKYARVSNSEDVQEVELQVPSYEEATSTVNNINNSGSLGESSTSPRSTSPAPPVIPISSTQQHNNDNNIEVEEEDIIESTNINDNNINNTTNSNSNETTPMISSNLSNNNINNNTNSNSNETTPMISSNLSNSNNNNSIIGRFSILNKIKRKPNNNNNGGGGAPHSTDGVFSNLSAKPETEAEKEEENPPPYEAAAADATPPYWEPTIIAPGLMGDEVLVEGLPVGNFFSFVWNMLVSMSFQFVGFLLTYLLHTSHAAKNGSQAGLGITLVQYGFYLRGKSLQDAEYYNYNDDDSDKDGLAKNEWLSYILMSLGWFIVIRSVTNYVRVKRVETIMRTTPEENV